VRPEDRGWRIAARTGSAPLPADYDRGCKRVGGTDFGFRNPFAAVWGLVDRDDVLWLVGEHYACMKPLSHHMQYLPRDVQWHADPSGAMEIAELRRADFKIGPGNNALRPGIAAVTARLHTQTLRILEGRCPKLVAEASMYRYSTEAHESAAETPVDEHNHALAALRYMITRLPTPRECVPLDPAEAAKAAKARRRRQRWWDLWHNEAMWTRLG
jgi:hypothetical protein